jgi:hypothetical protein
MADLEEEDFPGWQPLANYRGLRYGPNFNPSNRGAESIAIDGTKQRLRDPELGSPFTFRVRPPATIVNALQGRGGARTRGPFDPLLNQVFEDAVDNLQVVEQRFLQNLATEQELEDARNALLGGRPRPSNNINIIETAQAANSNFRRQLDARAGYDARSYQANSNTQGSGKTKQEDLIAANGERFNQRQVNGSNANQPAVSDLGQARDVLVQLNKVLATPPLTLLINPEQLQIQYTKKQIYQDRNRFNYIFQSWGEEQVRLSVTGKSAGFVVGAVGGAGTFEKTHQGITPTETDEPSGYQYASKWDSAAWQNLMGLFAFYRNNGYIYDNRGQPSSEAHLFIGNIEITYDQWVYVGNFENFRYSYAEGKQHGAVEFSFDFVASFIFDRSQGGVVQPLPQVTPSPARAAFDAGREFDALYAEGARANYTQTFSPTDVPALSTCILDENCDPFAPRNPSFGVELAPGLASAPPGFGGFGGDV